MLTPQQQRFADEYLIDSNATQAAIRAGYNKNSACAQGYKLLIKPQIKAYIDKKKQTIADKLGLDAEYVLRGLKITAENTIPKRHEPNPAAALKSFELLGKHLNMFEEDDKRGSQTFTVNILKF
jgi:phage terminase small subunit